jgi:LPXTG-motif cell wall-anchored protein
LRRRALAAIICAAAVPFALVGAQAVYASPAKKAHHHKRAQHPVRRGLSSGPRVKASTAKRSSDPGVTIADFLFSPGTITIHVGDTIVWSNNGPSPHSATANNGSFDTGVLSKGKSASVTFHTPGTFDYHCTIHPFMHGAVIVLAASKTTPSSTKTTPSSTKTTPSSTTPSSNSTPSSGAGTPSAGSNTSSNAGSSSSVSSANVSGAGTLPQTGANVLALVLTGALLTGAGLALRRRLHRS